MHARPGHTLKRYYYVCSTQNRRLDGSECKKSLSGRMVERSVWAYIERLVSEPQQIIDAITMARQGESNPRQEVERRIKALDTRLSAMERAKQKDLEAFEEDFIDRATLRELGKKYDMEKDEIAKQHMILEVELAQLGAPPPEMEALSLFLEGIKARIPGATIAQKKDVLRALKVVVYWVPQQPLRMDLTIPSRTAGLGCTVNMEIPPEVPGGPPQQPGETIQAYIQRLYADGRLSTVGLARRLNAERVPTPQSHRHQSQWSRYMVDYYMRDKRYAWK